MLERTAVVPFEGSCVLVPVTERLAELYSLLDDAVEELAVVEVAFALRETVVPVVPEYAELLVVPVMPVPELYLEDMVLGLLLLPYATEFSALR